MLVLFDLDDTLLNHREADRLAAQNLYERQAISSPLEAFLTTWKQAQEQHYKRYSAGEISFQEQRRARISDVLKRPLQNEEADALFTQYLNAYEENWKLFDDVLPCLNQLSSCRLGLITNGDGQQQRRKLEKTGLTDRFDMIVISSECGLSKPAPEIFLHACALAGEKPEHTLYVGDRYDLDALPARKAGLTGLWLDRTNARTEEHTPPIISSLSELERVIALPQTPSQ
jgi:putative hydrolase of the HAD superfamily